MYPWQQREETWHIPGRAVVQGREQKRRGGIKKMGVEEKSVRKGHNYLTMIFDLDRAPAGEPGRLFSPSDAGEKGEDRGDRYGYLGSRLRTRLFDELEH